MKEFNDFFSKYSESLPVRFFNLQERLKVTLEIIVQITIANEPV